jgi:uncharacterized coiled-coil DUF342 family protein
MGEKRDVYVEKLKTKLSEWNVEIDKFQAKADAAKEGAKVKYGKHVTELKKKRREVEEKMAGLQKAGDEAWKEVKKGVDTAWQEMSKSFKAAKSKFN